MILSNRVATTLELFTRVEEYSFNVAVDSIINSLNFNYYIPDKHCFLKQRRENMEDQGAIGYYDDHRYNQLDIDEQPVVSFHEY